MAKRRPEELLKQASDALKSRTPSMSLRAVAARIEISPSYWSKILRGEKPLPQNKLPEIFKVLAMDAQQIAQLQRAILDTIESEQLVPATGMRTGPEVVDSPVENYRSLGREAFWILDEWFYIPVLNLFSIHTFDGKVEKICAMLGLREDQASDSLRRLVHYGFLIEKNGALVRTDQQIRFPTHQSFAQVRKYHQSMLQKARQELADNKATSFDGRLISAVCFSGSSTKLKEARLILEEAMYRAANLMADEPGSDEVYQLNVQLFPLLINKPS